MTLGGCLSPAQGEDAQPGDQRRREQGLAVGTRLALLSAPLVGAYRRRASTIVWCEPRLLSRERVRSIQGV